MGRKKRLIIPIFIPFGGCPNQCVFCDQNGITGAKELPGLNGVAETIESYLSTWRGEGAREVAFYGGSFTGLDITLQLKYLDVASRYIKAGRIDSIRVSTRPDYIDEERVCRLKSFGVETVELGVQSMSDSVLALSGRGHCSADARRAASLLKSAGMKTGAQFMPGLPGDTAESVLETTREVIRLSPDFVRVYPTLVLRGTPLHRMYLEGRYAPWTLADMVEVCARAACLLREAGIPIIRMGLRHDKTLIESLVAGPSHPSFGQLVAGRIKSTGRPQGT